ncbi:MAG: N-acetyltransferase family protein [Candidatus Limnocylindrales bacterium]
MTSTARPGRRAGELTYRPARPDELGICAEVWRASINDYIVPLGQHEIPPDSNQVTRLFTHLQSTDPERFVVATRLENGIERVVAFTSAVVRERLWYLSMLFVLPDHQGVGVGREMLARILPADGDAIRSTATDSAQPISNALYATYGIAPRMPLLNFVGYPQRPAAFGSLPSGIVPVPFETIAAGSAAGEGHDGLIRVIDSLDREIVGIAHPQDHRYLRTEARHGWLYHGPDGLPIGYGYAGESGRLGPVAVRDPDLLAPILGHLTSAVIPRGASAIWIGGPADRALIPLLQAGFRLEAFPVLLCWDRPFADFSRYLPSSPGLL